MVTVLLQRRVRNHVMDAARRVGYEVADYSCHIMSSRLLLYPLLSPWVVGIFA